jgi:hypothetical protein
VTDALTHLAPRVRDPFASALAWQDVVRYDLECLDQETIAEHGDGEWPPFVRETS